MATNYYAIPLYKIEPISTFMIYGINFSSRNNYCLIRAETIFDINLATGKW